MSEQSDPAWVDVPTGHAICLREGTIVARNAKGKELKSVPPAVKKTEEFGELDRLGDWLRGHEREAAAEVDRWLTRGLPVPVALIEQVWPDPAWSGPLTDLVVQVEGRGGFLRGARVEQDGPAVGVVTLDGDTEWLSAQTLTVPHPVLLGDDLADYREFAVELGITQRLPQLLRDIYTPEGRDEKATSVRDFAGGTFEQLRFATGRAVSLGYKVQGGYAVAIVWEDGCEVEARYWLGADAPDYETVTDELVWVHGTSSLPLGEVGPVAYSEGMRMAAQIYAGRKSDDSEDEN